ncbi:MAG: redox-regulated ATPase YchF [candidate division Zixibacteria bacterium]|nr:redox-regulated ATPase YchF [Candidatus Tariuqbacter arcticus]
MQVGIVGPQGSGKSTLFQCLTGLEAAASGKVEIIRGIAQTRDERLELIANFYNSRKTTPTTVEYVDAPPVEAGGLKRDSFRAIFLRGLEQTDALLMVIPAFLPGQIEKGAETARDIQTEFILCDLESVEKRLSKIDRDLQRGVKGEIDREGKLLMRCKDALENEKPLIELDFSPAEDKLTRGFTFLSRKPILNILNIAEENLAVSEDLARESGIENAVPLCAAVEAEIAALPDEDIPAFLLEMGIRQSAREKVLAKTRDMLELITFYTAADNEARAWNLKRGSTALQAAGVVHTDMERGFIRAEVIHFDDLKPVDSITELRAQGAVHIQGKEYIVADGDLMLFRFNV